MRGARPPRQDRTPPPPCRDWAARGMCPYGEGCRFLHDPPAATPATPSDPSPAPSGGGNGGGGGNRELATSADKCLRWVRSVSQRWPPPQLVYELGNRCKEQWAATIDACGADDVASSRLFGAVLLVVANPDVIGDVNVLPVLVPFHEPAGQRAIAAFLRLSAPLSKTAASTAATLARQGDTSKWTEITAAAVALQTLLQALLAKLDGAAAVFENELETVAMRVGGLIDAAGSPPPAELAGRVQQLREGAQMLARLADAAERERQDRDLRAQQQLADVERARRARSTLERVGIAVLDDPEHDRDYLRTTAMPTPDEITSSAPAALPVNLARPAFRAGGGGGQELTEAEDAGGADAGDVAGAPAAGVSAGPYRNVDHYLNTHFMLLREDCLAQMRRGLESYRRGTGPSPSRESIDATAFDVSTTRGDGRANAYVDVTAVDVFSLPRVGIVYEMAFALPRGLRKVDWRVSSRLMTGTLLCLAREGIVDPATLVLATVARAVLPPDASTQAVAAVAARPRVMIVIAEESQVRFDPKAWYVMLESPVFFESYRPVMEALQAIGKSVLPFEPLLLGRSREVAPPLYLMESRNGTRSDLKSLFAPLSGRRPDGGSTPTASRWNLKPVFPAYPGGLFDATVPNAALVPFSSATPLDDSQRAAVALALSRQVALIQGPPGTGKTFVGVLISRLLLANKNLRADKPVLFVCQTNHALDAILEHIYPFEPNMIRVGGRSQSETMKKLTMDAARHRIGQAGAHLPRRSQSEFDNLLDLQSGSQGLRLLWIQRRMENPMLPFNNAVLVRLVALLNSLSSLAPFAANLVRNIAANADDPTTLPVPDPSQALDAAAPAAVQARLVCAREARLQALRARGSQPPAWAQVGALPHEWNQPDADTRLALLGIFSPTDQPTQQTSLVDEWARQRPRGHHHRGTRAGAADANGWQTVGGDGVGTGSGPAAAPQGPIASSNGPDDDDETDRDEQADRDLWGDDDGGLDGTYNSMQTSGRGLSKQEASLRSDARTARDVDRKRIELALAMLKVPKPMALGAAASLTSDELRALAVKETRARDVPGNLRGVLASAWRKLLVADAHLSLSLFATGVRDAQRVENAYNARADAAVLQQAAVVGMTTTGAAKYSQLLRDLAPEVVVVEEAAEVLEASIVASLGSNTKHLILIGDHQQLRPQVAEYKLATHFALEVSLFERLAQAGLPVVTLSTQRRMHPEIAALIRPAIYPHLVDDGGTRSHPPVRGMKHRLFFLDHREPETVQDAHGEASGSKTNAHEAAVLVRLARYLLQQGYMPSHLVFLTMYRGQLRVLERIAKEVDAAKKDGSTVASIRRATTDNYQGEECDVVLLSLVRSNGKNDIGFLKTANRVCVALSRARHGLYVVGNLDLLQRASQLWSAICRPLAAQGQLGPGLQLAQCPRHPSVVPIIVARASDFDNAPNGGCSLPCGGCYDGCGHPCRRMCHPAPHGDLSCPEVCERPRPPSCVHPCKQRCGVPCPPCPVRVQRLRIACGHTIELPCGEDVAGATCHAPCDAVMACSHKCPLRCHGMGHTPAVEAACKQPCTRLLGCGHPCPESCGAPCGRCKTDVSVPLACGHAVRGPCGASPVTLACPEPCARKLSCGHACDLLCRVPCTTACSVEVNKPRPSCTAAVPHLLLLACSAPLPTGPCPEVCGATLPRCGHRCQGVCGTCTVRSDGAHPPCAVQCTRILACGHPCAQQHLCADGLCPPCRLPCEARATTEIWRAAAERDLLALRSDVDADLPNGRTADLVQRLSRIAAWCKPSDPRCTTVLCLLGSVQAEARDWHAVLATFSQVQQSVLPADPAFAEAAFFKAKATLLGQDPALAQSWQLQKAADLLTHALGQCAQPGPDRRVAALLDEVHRVQAQRRPPTTMASPGQQRQPHMAAAGASPSPSAVPSRPRPGPAPAAAPAVGSPPATTATAPATASAAPELHAKAKLGDVQAVQQLLREGADPARQDDDGNTALLVALKANVNVATLEVLLTAGAWHVPNKAQLTVGELALRVAPSPAAEAVLRWLDDVLAQPLATVDPGRRWAAMRARRGATSAAMDKIMALTGLAQVKRCALELVDNVAMDQAREPSARIMPKQALNFIFEGNPGTGKTTVARYFAELLGDLGLRPVGSKVTETTGQKLLVDGISKFQAMLQACIPGVLFVDEVYQLEPLSKSDGRSITDALMDATENERTRLTVIVAGYKDDIRDKWLASNSGLRSRFPIVVTFEDLGEAELRHVFLSQLREQGWRLESEPGVDVATVAARRLARASNRKGFANSRSVRAMLEQALRRANTRMLQTVAPPTDMLWSTTLTAVDVLGAPVDPERSRALAKLQSLTGLAQVKATVAGLVRLVDANYRSELKGEAVLEVPLHRLFLGNPGTGKTTVAKIYGQVLAELGLLSHGGVDVVGASKLTGEYVGSTAASTNKFLDAAVGKVLVIDEAYVLHTHQFGREALDVLVERVQGTPGEDFAVVLCGYETQMSEMLRKGNPGLSRRFRFDDAIRFGDYDDEQLLAIMCDKAREMGLFLEPAVARAAVANVLAKQRAKPNFGNAGAATNLLVQGQERLMQRPAETRTKVDGRWVLLAADLFEAPSTGARSALDALSGLSNVDGIRSQMERLQKRLLVDRKEGKSPEELLRHWVFAGPPGTGKTTVARAFGKLYHDLGLLADDRVVERKAQDLMASFVGQSAPLVNAAMEEARGGVLFIDEAYGLVPSAGNFGKDVLETLLANMTLDTYRGKLVIILAGYQRDMDTLLAANEGLRRRFTERLTFSDWSSESCADLCLKRLQVAAAPAELVASLTSGFDRLRLHAGWGNAGDAVTVAERMRDERAQRADADGNVSGGYTVDDVNAAFADVLAQRPNQPVASAPMSSPAPPVMPAAAPGPTQPGAARARERPSPPSQSATNILEQHEAPIAVADDGEEGSDENWSACLEKALKACGYDLPRQVAILEAATLLPEEVVSEAATIPPASLKPSALGLVRDQLERQRPRVLLMARCALKLELDRQRRLREAVDEEARKRVEEELAKERAIQHKLRTLGRCPMGFEWLNVGGGYRCAGGSHFVSLEQLR
jgi:SpoVK/Ycf46/Vps4 family AAA+-type ATPase